MNIADNTERNARICALRGLKSASLIASELGISRNAVIGVWYRAGLSSSQGVMPEQVVARRRKAKKIKVKRPPGHPAVPDFMRRWVLAEAEKLGVCAAAKAWGFSPVTVYRWRRDAPNREHVAA